MKNIYFIDFEYNGMGGLPISMSLLRNNGDFLYVRFTDTECEYEPWVRDNVLPVLTDCPVPLTYVTRAQASVVLEAFFEGKPTPHVIADYPDDIKYLMELLVVSPGECIKTPHMTFEWNRFDAYPTELEGAVQHNAWWDTQAMAHKFGFNTMPPPAASV